MVWIPALAVVGQVYQLQRITWTFRDNKNDRQSGPGYG